MPFKKNHQQGAKPMGEESMDRTPVCFNVRKGVRDKLKAVPEWKERLREYVDQLVDGQIESDG